MGLVVATWVGGWDLPASMEAQAGVMVWYVFMGLDHFKGKLGTMVFVGENASTSR